MKIIVSVFNNLSTDQRVEKVCQTLYNQGHEIVLIGNDRGNLSTLERPYDCIRIPLLSNSLKLAYPEFNLKLFKLLQKLQTDDTLLIANDLDTLTANYLISKKYALPLVYDSHEIYTEMPALQHRFTKKIWERLEKKLLPNVKNMMTASNGYADWYAKKYNRERPVVVQNFPYYQVDIQSTTPNPRKTIVYQGVLNPSRGIDKLLKALHLLPEVDFWIIGDGPRKKEYENLSDQLGLKDRVTFWGQISPTELKKITPRADVGISIEENNGESYYYSLPNKISDYIQARVPIVTSNFPEMSAIVNQYHVGETIVDHSPEEIAKQISKVLQLGKNYYRDNLDNAAKNLCWENESNKLIELIEKAAANRPLKK